MRSNKPIIRQTKPDTRRYAVLPARSIQDDDLHVTSLRVLGAICLHTNKYGICFPSRVTLGRHVSRTPKTISFHVTRLIKLGYIRKLKKRGYRIPAHEVKSRYATNRYQVLYDGPATLLPTREQFYAPRPKIAEEYPTEGVIYKSKGLARDGEAEAKRIAQGFCAGIEKVTGQHKIPDNYLIDARILADKGILAEDVERLTVISSRKRLASGQSSLLSLKILAEEAGLL